MIDKSSVGLPQDDRLQDNRPQIAIVAGSGFNTFFYGDSVGERQTPYGETSTDIVIASSLATKSDIQPVAFLARHGLHQRIPPHKINYRANIWSLKQLGVHTILAVNVVGAIRTDFIAGNMVIPHQLIDYTYGREHTFSTGLNSDVDYVDFTHPFTPLLRERLLLAAQNLAVDVADGSVYGVTQGPRLETSAEIHRLENDGCDLVGMTAMPEAVLARELGINYASLCLVVNPAAGRGKESISTSDVFLVSSGC